MQKIDFKGVVTPKTYGINWNRPTTTIQQEQNRTEAKIEPRKISNPRNAKQRLLNTVFTTSERKASEPAPVELKSAKNIMEKAVELLKTKRK